jgi:hypothetical protein
MALRLNGKLADVYIDNEDNQNDLKNPSMMLHDAP